MLFFFSTGEVANKPSGCNSAYAGIKDSFTQSFLDRHLHSCALVNYPGGKKNYGEFQWHHFHFRNKTRSLKCPTSKEKEEKNLGKPSIKEREPFIAQVWFHRLWSHWPCEGRKDCLGEQVNTEHFQKVGHGCWLLAVRVTAEQGKGIYLPKSFDRSLPHDCCK